MYSLRFILVDAHLVQLCIKVVLSVCQLIWIGGSMTLSNQRFLAAFPKYAHFQCKCSIGNLLLLVLDRQTKETLITVVSLRLYLHRK